MAGSFALPAAAFLVAGLTMAAPAAAAEPGYYRVSGVAAGDVLNVRAAPHAGAEIVDTLAPGAAPVEVLEVEVTGSGEWGRVLSADSNGWVAMRFLVPETPPGFGGTEVPQGLTCLGTEPFWDLELVAGGRLRFSAVDTEELSLPLVAGTAAVARIHRFALIAGDGKRRATAVLGRYESCSDGMSERDFGWRIDLVLEGVHGDGAVSAYEGCCMLPVDR